MIARRTPRIRLGLSSFVAFTLAAVAAPRDARAEPWFGWGDGKLEDRYLDGDIDVEDLVEGTRVARSRGGSQQLRVGTWLTVSSFVRTVFGKVDVGTMLLVGAALDRAAQGSTLPTRHLVRPDGLLVLADGPAQARPPSADAGSQAPAAPAPPPLPQLVVTPLLARQAVAAAWRTSGIGADDARIDSMISRARESAALPEMRLRVMKVVNDSSQIGVIPTDTSTYDIAGANLYLEGRLTWRLDRLLYADDEPGLERSRLERQDARARISAKVIDTLFQWQRALVAQRGALPASKELIDATLRVAESQAALDVLTGGWFGGWLARQAAESGPR
jgi:hypothetical protein